VGKAAAPAAVATTGVSATVYALFTSGTASGINAVAIDASSGNITHLKSVTGPAGQYFAGFYGGTTRVFPFDALKARFYVLDIDQSTASPDSAITLYGIDPATGGSFASTVTGATGKVVSFELHKESGAMVFATQVTPADFSFYSLDLDTLEATLLDEVHIVSLPSGYCGYISGISSDGATVLRLGYESVVDGTGPGLGTTLLNGDGGVATWRDVPQANGTEFQYSLTRRPGTDSYVSLAPASANGHNLAVVEWTLDGEAKVVLSLANAHPPATGSEILGYVADDVNDSTYIALVVRQVSGGLLPGAKDQWELVALDLDTGTGGAVDVTGDGRFEPFGAETIGVSGVGIAK